MPVPRDVVEIIVKLREGGTLRPAQGGRFQASHLDLTKLEHFVTGLPNAKLIRSFPRDPVEQVERHDRAELRLGRAIPSPNLFLRLRVPASQDVDRILADLTDLAHRDPASGIEYACRAGIPGPPPQVADLSGEQGYCDPTPDGVDAAYAWSLPGGDGTGVQVCDCEYGFDTQHQDLPLVAGDVVTGWAALNNALPTLPAGFEDHGTAVLGILGAKADGVGVTGICHGAGVLFASEATVSRTACIEEAAAALGPGDVLLLEMQEGPGPVWRPAEADPDVHAQILDAVGNGVVVVEAAANGNTDLATLTNTNGEAIWDPASPQEDDSLAILVAAGWAPAQATSLAAAATKVPTSNYGARVDCQGWGGCVVTTGYGVPTYLSNPANQTVAH